ncbi:MAG: zinc-binding dehydrogenase [Victivallaceae bacterium]|nr:zinc-binding dehydrogenase [Victivallaceae bacterium]
MKIVKLDGKGQTSFKEIAKPEGDDQHVIIKVKGSALCGTEIHTFKDHGVVREGMYNAGHEVVGVIESAPLNSLYKAGMRVGACVVQGCGRCDFCQAGYETACLNKTFYASNGHAEYFKLGLNGVRVLPDNIDWPTGAILSGDGLGVPVRASRRLGDTAGKKILVLGLGPIGLGNVLVQAFKGAEVMGADFVEYRTELAGKLGAVGSINLSKQDLKEAVLEWTAGKGADIVILAVGKAEALLSAVEVVKHQGTIFQVAEFTSATINPSAMFVAKELTMTGSWYYTSADWPVMLDLYSKGLAIDKLITHVIPFEQAQEAFEIFVSGNSGKVVMSYN